MILSLYLSLTICLHVSTAASFEQVCATCLPLVCSDLWPPLFPGSRRHSQGAPPYRRICHSSCVCARIFLMQRLHCVWKCFPLRALQHRGSINNSATHCGTQCYTLHSALPLKSPQYLSALLFDCFYAPIMFPSPPSPSPPSSAHFICLRALVMFPQLELRICQTSHFFLHSLVSVFFFSLLAYSWFSFIYCIH